MQHKKCPACNELKSADQYHGNARQWDGLQTYCIACSKAKDAERCERRRAAGGEQVQKRNKQKNRAKWAEDMMRSIHPNGRDY